MKLNHTEKATLVEYYRSLLKTADEEKVQKFLKGEIEYSENAPFLSIVMRTQGKRPEALSEVLLCLNGQSDMDFEVLLMGHNLDDEGKATVNRIISKQPECLRKKIKLIEVIGGNRTTPLNKGFEAANGRYISILDDDDLVLENWVEVFHSLEENNRGKILHSYCVSQDWKSVQNAYGETVLVSVSKFEPMYCRSFDYAEQFITNHCPTFSLAFPNAAYKYLGIRFDETLTTTEDWDFLMRTAAVCGVADEPTVTGIYRKWINTESSATLHNEIEWRKNYRRIQKMLLKGSHLLPSNTLDKLLEAKGVNLNAGQLKTDEFSLVIDTAKKTNVEPKLSFEFDDVKWTVRVENIADLGQIKRVKVIPAKKGSVLIHDPVITITDDEGNSKIYSVDKLNSWGIRKKGSLAFLMCPKFCAKVKPAVRLSELTVEFEIVYGFAAPRIKRILLAVPRKIKKMLVKIIKKLLKV